MDSLFEYWFNPENERVWFTSTPEDDKYITTKFGYLIKKLYPTIDDYTVNEIDPKESLFYILIYDQVSRHVSRFFNQTYPSEHITIAHRYSFQILKTFPDLKPFSNKEIPFVLLPYRHTQKIINLEFVKRLSLKLHTENPDSYIRRFYQATVRQIAKQKTPKKVTTKLTTTQLEQVSSILDSDSVRLSNISDTLKQDKLIKKHPLIMALHSTLPTPKTDQNKPHILLSISGGKDSMALARALKYIKTKYPDRFDLSAIHINYMNRETSLYDEYLTSYFVNELLNIPLYVRRITEIQRSRVSDERRFYEAVTREIRFRTYQQIDQNAYVVLGHNADDTIENIITNISKQQHYENLLGMTVNSIYTSTNSPTKTLIWRPLLNIKKTVIEDFNGLTNTPFTYDSTPSWSSRGRIRDSVIPVLTDFTPTVLKGLTELSKVLTQLSNTYETYVLPKILETNVSKISDVTLQIKYDPKVFTEKVFRDIFSHYKIQMPSQKALKDLLKKLKSPQGSQGSQSSQTFVLSKNMSILISNDKMLTLTNVT